jgi:ribosomal protein S18 acetylase RimI-like enzyme
VWVFADNQAAVNFYRSRSFTVAEAQPVYMTHRVR